MRKNWLKPIAFAVCLTVFLTAFFSFGCQKEEEPSFNAADYPFYTEDYTSLTYGQTAYEAAMAQPYWLGNVMYNELTLPLRYDSGEAYAKLLYAPLKVVCVMDQKLKITYEEGTDYVVDRENRRLTIPDGSSIPLLSEGADAGVNPPDGYEYTTGMPDASRLYTIWGGGTPYVYTESSYFYAKYLSVTYAYDVSALPKNLFNSYDVTYLYRTRTKLESKQDITVAVLGDSISEGCSSTGDSLKVEPYTPCYAKQIKAELERIYGGNVNLVNAAKGGTKSEWPLTGEGSGAMQNAIDAVPDLCIVAYGMNDMGGTTKNTFKTNIEQIMMKIKAASPDCDFILINSFPCNPLYEQGDNVFGKYLNALEEISAENNDGSVKVIDMQSVGKYFMETKRYCEISSSNVNHPNDFMHRVYAMNVMTAICNYKF